MVEGSSLASVARRWVPLAVGGTRVDRVPVLMPPVGLEPVGRFCSWLEARVGIGGEFGGLVVAWTVVVVGRGRCGVCDRGVDSWELG